MSQSIFHVRPLDAGKGWAIDEYDGRGAWQRTVLKTPEGGVMDKQQAQRAVFQLRRKAVNSVPKAGVVNNTAAQSPDWSRLKEEVGERIDALAAVHGKLDAPPEWRAKIWNDLALPNLRLLAEFCTNITFDDEGEVAS